jgi:glutamate---cysteine ligase / carboxylate-amine ligase
MYLTHALTRYSPLLIALSAASPYWRGIDTGFDCCRLNVVSAFPMSGTCPAVRSWRQFERFFGEMQRRGVVASMKDFYWDVRPKPEFGTVEVRVCDTPLRVADAVDIAALVQALAADLLAREREWPDEYFEWIYARNRFQACRYGFDGQYLDVDDPAAEIRTIGAALEDLLVRLAPRFAALDSRDCLERLLVRTRSSSNGASWLRGQYRSHANFPALVRGMGAELLAPAPVAA